MRVGNVLRRCAANFPKKQALVFGRQRVTYNALNRRVNCLANYFNKMGLQKGDRVAVLLHNCPEFFETYFACARSGGVFVPINNLLRQKELKQILEYIQPRFLVFDADFSSTVKSCLEGLKGVQVSIMVRGDQEGCRQYNDLIAGGDETEPAIAISDDDIVNIFLTSGTTGRPKGALRNHRHEVVNMMTSAIEQGIRQDDRALLLFPFYHITFADSLRHILMANTVVIRREGNFDAEEVLGLLVTEQITTWVKEAAQADSAEAGAVKRNEELMVEFFATYGAALAQLRKDERVTVIIAPATQGRFAVSYEHLVPEIPPLALSSVAEIPRTDHGKGDRLTPELEPREALSDRIASALPAM